MTAVAWLVLSAGVVGGLSLARIRWRNWGATPAEMAVKLPGDDLIPDPAAIVTRAVTVQAPASEVWRWLVQVGQGRGGMYSYDRLENLIGLRIHSADMIRDEWQDLQVGDQIRLIRPGWLGLAEGYSLPVVRVDRGRAIVLRMDPWEAVWSFHVVEEGDNRCRLLSRSRETVRPGFTAGLARSAGQIMDPITLIMTRKMLLGIKERAERHWRATTPDRVPARTAQEIPT